jgi:hypothetical protein
MQVGAVARSATGSELCDEQLQLASASALRASSYPRLAVLVCSASTGTVTVCGRVKSYHRKRLAQPHVLRVNRVRSICNRVQIG